VGFEDDGDFVGLEDEGLTLGKCVGIELDGN
jgi:hypothetical protein